MTTTPRTRSTSRIVVRDAAGLDHVVDAEVGLSLMEALRPLDLGIGGECEGSLACATCHVWIDPGRAASFGEASDAEAEMLDCAFYVRANSRLSCQIRVSHETDGLVVEVPNKAVRS